MNAQQEQELRESTKRYSLIDGALWSIMMQVGTYFIIPFALFIKAPILIVSALNAFPFLLDGFGQKLSGSFVEKGISRKNLLVLAAGLQAFFFFLLALLAFFSHLIYYEILLLCLIIFVTFIYFFGGLTSPPWAALINDVVGEKHIASWLGYRLKIIGIVGILSLILAGAFLDFMKPQNTLLGFTVLFFIAFVARAISTYALILHWEPRQQEQQKQQNPTKDANDAAFLVFLMFFSIMLGSLYLKVYVLDILKFEYFWYTIAFAIHDLFASLAAPYWGRAIEKYGSKTVWVASLAINSIGTFSFIFVKTPLEAIIANIFAGAVWGGIVLPYINYLYQITNPNERIRAIGNANFMLGLGSFLGILLGGIILDVLGSTLILSFHILFLITGILRILTAIYIDKKAKEVPAQVKKSSFDLLLNIVTVFFWKIGFDEVRNTFAFIKEKLKRRSKIFKK